MRDKLLCSPGSAVDTLNALWRLMRGHQPVGSLLLLWPTMIALFAAHHGAPSCWFVLVYILGVFLARSMGCVINDLLDSDLDRQVARTRLRPLAAGHIKRSEAVVLFAGLAVMGLGLVYALPYAVWWLTALAVPLLLGYPLAKRFLYVPQCWLGVAFAWGVPMAYASTGAFPSRDAWLLYAATVCWIVGFDSIYALQDVDDDKQLALHSAAKTFGDGVWMFVGGCYALCLLFFAAWLVQTFGVMRIHAAFLLTMTWALAWQVISCRSMLERQAYDFAGRVFFSNIWVGLVAFLYVLGLLVR